MNVNHLKEGSMAPLFKAETWQEKEIALQKYQGKKIWLSFFRYASCPLCNLRVQAMKQRVMEWQTQGLEVIAVFESPKESFHTAVGSQEPPFPMIADPKGELYLKYGLDAHIKGLFHKDNLSDALQAFKHGFLSPKVEGKMHRIPADFLIDEQGIIHTAFYGQRIGDRIPFEKVEAFLKTPKAVAHKPETQNSTQHFA